MRGIVLFSLFSLCFITLALAQENNILLDDFECAISGGPDGTVDFGAGNGSSVEVAGDREIKNSGEQSLKLTFNALPGGYMWVAKGFNLDASNAGWLVKPKEINWQDYGAISFYLYGANSGTNIALDIKDNGNEMWRFMVVDDFEGWKQIACPFQEFVARDDWQPQDADNNFNLDFPLQSYQLEPRPEAKGILYFDQVELAKQKGR
ncbi:MAG: carbohydrate binding domain-containing protein [Candidatus Omnitrophota bacterium]